MCQTPGVEVPTQLELADRFVRPWYLKMMRLNACEYGQALAAEISRAGRQADDDILVRLLRSGWRERVMGAWMAVTRDSERVTKEVLTQLERSHGSLDAPPLATASVVLAGPMSMPALVRYHEADTAQAGVPLAWSSKPRCSWRSGSQQPTPSPSLQRATVTYLMLS
jgi:hypothetical protein